MRLTRLRFTVRTMMIGVAVVALCIVVLTPLSHRLIWLYRNPPTTLALFAGKIDFVPVHSPSSGTTSQARRGPAPVGQPLEAESSYDVSILPSVPSGLIYWGSVEVKLTDSSPTRVVLESHNDKFMLIAGKNSWDRKQGRFSCKLTPPTPGQYFDRYEVYLTDPFGRKTMVACSTGGFQAK